MNFRTMIIDRKKESFYLLPPVLHYIIHFRTVPCRTVRNAKSLRFLKNETRIHILLAPYLLTLTLVQLALIVRDLKNPNDVELVSRAVV